MLRHQEDFVRRFNLAFNGWTEDGVWVAGGAARGYALNEPFGDFDLFFKDGTTFAKFYTNMLEKNPHTFEYVDGGNEDVYVSLKADGCVFQLYCKRYFPSWEAVVDDFDFTHCQFAVNHHRHAFWTKQGHEDAINKELRAHNLKFPVVALRRINKFLAAGYAPCDGFWQDVVTKLKAIEDTNANIRTSP